MFLEKLHTIESIVLDIDGVLTDGTVLVTENGDQLRKFNIKDGYALQLAIKKGYHICIISGGKSESVVYRLKSLGITEFYLGINEKKAVYQSFIQKHQLQNEQVLYIGDDIPDLPVMKLAGVATCPADAVEEVKAISHYISPKNGGEGCVRDVLEKVMKIQGRWYDPDALNQTDDTTPSK